MTELPGVGPQDGRSGHLVQPPGDPLLTTEGVTTIGTALVEVRVTVPDAEVAERLAREVVTRKLAACVQVLGPIASVYTWKDEVHRASEWLLLIKSTESAFEELCAVVQGHHRYDVPEVLAVPVTHTLEAYGQWVRDNSRGVDGS